VLRLGIDVGGTHTDAVLLDGQAVLAHTKALTSADVLSGILEALESLLAYEPGIERKVDAVMLGTTQFTNAVVERRELAAVAAIRIGLPSGRGLPPRTGWPDDIAAALGGQVYAISGGCLYDGWPVAVLDDAEISRVIDDLVVHQVDSVCLTSAFAPMNAQPEVTVGQQIQQRLPNIRITYSHQLGRLGLIERENAALLNASLLPFADRVVRSFTAAIEQRGLRCRFLVSQNDGTLMDANFARAFPALTFASGPTNSLRGASLLTGLQNAVVIDIGGTTSDIGVIQDGFPRESNVAIDVGGVRTNFRMPDIHAIGLGGGSLVQDQGHTIGPRSVGHKLVTQSQVFGGKTLTVTDIAVAMGRVCIGDTQNVNSLPASTIAAASDQIESMLNIGVEQMKPNSGPLPVILVGGGAVLVSDELSSASEVHRPEHADVANAIGAAIAQIGGESEALVSYEKLPRDEAIADITARATRSAIAAGAQPNTIRTADIEETAISYMSNNTTRLRIKVVGEIDTARQSGQQKNTSEQ